MKRKDFVKKVGILGGGLVLSGLIKPIKSNAIVKDNVKGSVATGNVPVGTMYIFAGEKIPEGYLLCDGSAVSRAAYASLFNVIGTVYGAGDGSTTFNIPDMQEVAPIGVGTSKRTEDAHDVYKLGEFKDDQLQDHIQSVSTSGGNHNHPLASLRNGVDQNYGLAHGGAYAYNVVYWHSAGLYSSDSGNLSMSGSATTVTAGRHGSVTRNKGIGVNYIIKY